MHPRALLVAMDAALNGTNMDTAIGLAKTLKTEGIPLRQHYFWPLLAQHTKNKNPQGIVLFVFTFFYL
jgi:leucine-rich PPR motif-containing protein